MKTTTDGPAASPEFEDGFACPHCGKRGISFPRRLFLGPAVPASCRACGQKVRVPSSSGWTVLPFLILNGLAINTGSMALTILVFITTAVMTIFYQLKFVPLIKVRDDVLGSRCPDANSSH